MTKTTIYGTNQIRDGSVGPTKVTSGVIIAAGTNPFSGNQDMGGFKITGAADPSSATDYATKQYVDAAAVGLDVKPSVRVATAAALPAYTRTTNVITATVNAALAAVDGVTLVLNDRLLLKDGAAGADNGLYYVSQVGTGATPYTLTRTTDADVSAEVTAGLYVFVEEGTVNADSGWILTTNNPITLNTTALTFVQFTGLGSIMAGFGLTKTGSVIDVVAGNASIVANADEIHVGYAGATPVAVSIAGGAVVGTGVTPSHEDHAHAGPGFAVPSASAVGDAQANGSAATVNHSDHVHAREAFAAPNTIVLGSAAANGSAATLIRSDAGIAAFDATAPSTQAVGDAAVVGVINFAARRDHKHAIFGFGLPAASAVGDVQATGSALTVNHSDHVHAREAFAAPAGSNPSDAQATGSAATINHSDHVHARERWVFQEIPSGTLDGSNKTFGLAHTPLGSSLSLYVNGVLQKAGAGNDYTIATATITVEAAAPAPVSGDNLLAIYYW